MVYKWLVVLWFGFSGLILGQGTVKSVQNLISVDVKGNGERNLSVRSGVFLEEINHACDGGLYAEMIRNRGFEEKSIIQGGTIEKGFLILPQKSNYYTGKIGNWKIPWDTIDKWPGWKLIMKSHSDASMKLVTSNPLNLATPHSMQIDVVKADSKSSVSLINEGYWGIAVTKGRSYNLRFFLRCGAKFKGPVTAQLITRRGKILGSEEIQLKNDSLWNEYKVKLSSLKTDNQAWFVLNFKSTGRLWVDYVSLFPGKTFQDRVNGLRPDAVKMIATLKPEFIRWPGGCTAEGITLNDRVKWKETLGDPVSRPGTFGLWGYRNSCGLGYHEFLQFCEDLGSSALFVCNAGFSCANRYGESCSEDEVPFFVQEALDAIEYALGDSTTSWGKKRIAAGHRAPFSLKYVEIGNEGLGIAYAQRFNRFYRAIKERYPQIVIISSGEFQKVGQVEKEDMIDFRFYRNPQWFFRNVNLFDNKLKQVDSKICIGGYAANQGVQTKNLNSALSEAAFMTGLERNSTRTGLVSYGPVIANAGDRTYPINMVWMNGNNVYGSSSYYVQKLFIENKPDILLPCRISLSGMDMPKLKFKGLTGLGTSSTNVDFKDFSISQPDQNYSSDYFNRQEDWEPYYGHWRVENGEYIQGDLGIRRVSLLHDKVFGNCTIEVKARKIKGDGGFMVLFGGLDKDQYYQLNVGGNGNRGLFVEKIMEGIGMAVSDTVPFLVESNRWYDIKVILYNDEAECFIDGKSLLKYKIKEDPKRYIVAGFDKASSEIVLKVVNAEPIVFNTKINLSGAEKIEPQGKVIMLTSSSPQDENSVKDPEKLVPRVKIWRGFSDNFNFEFKPYSLTILRIRQK